MENNKWSELSVKDKAAIITAFMTLCLGWILTIAGFIVEPLGEVTDSVLWILGQAMIYAASVFGLASYFNAETQKMKRDMNDMITRYRKETEIINE